MGKKEERLKAIEEKLEAYRRQLVEKKQQRKPVRALKRHIKLKRETLTRQRKHLKKLKTKHAERMKKLRQRMESRRQSDKAAIDGLELKIETQKETRDYNLATSLKSYIDPRIYYEWGKQVNYDWKRYYSKALLRKITWVETNKTPPEKG